MLLSGLRTGHQKRAACHCFDPLTFKKTGLHCSIQVMKNGTLQEPFGLRWALPAPRGSSGPAPEWKTYSALRLLQTGTHI